MLLKPVTILFFSYCILLISYNYYICCNTYYGYLLPFFNSDCYYCPDLHENITTIIHKYVGNSETHNFQTTEGYILTIFRIPHQNPRDVIIMDHPLLFDSSIWVSQQNDSIAFLFWRAGYDVWLPNRRGSYYSKKHVKFSNTDPQFWNHSFHEIGFHDVRDTINYVKKITKQKKVIYMGVSGSGTTGLVYAITRPEDALNSVKIMIALTPGTTFIHGTSVLLKLTYPVLKTQSYFDYKNSYLTIGAYNSWYMKLSRLFFVLNPFKKIPFYLLEVMYGWTQDEFDPNLISLLFMNFGSETSLKLLSHHYQINFSGKFRMYDYGKLNNLNIYGNSTPPEYDLNKINIPIFIIYGLNDSLISPEDSELFYSKLPEKAKIYGKMALENTNHVDVIFGRNRNKIYNKIIKLLNKMD